MQLSMMRSPMPGDTLLHTDIARQFHNSAVPQTRANISPAAMKPSIGGASLSHAVYYTNAQQAGVPLPSGTPPLTLETIGDGSGRVAIDRIHTKNGVAYNFRGVWSSSFNYVIGDEVVFQTTYWLCTAGNKNSAPSTSSNVWQAVASYNQFLGAWNSGTQYAAGAEVTFLGNYWVAVNSNLASPPSTSNPNWQIAGPVDLDSVADGSTFGRIPTSNYGQKTAIGNLTGFEALSNADFENGLTNWSVYDNNSSGSVAISLVSDSASPNGMGLKLKIVEAKVGSGPAPGLGGFFYRMDPDAGTIQADHVHVGDTYIIDLVANIPIGYTLNFASNSLGTGGSFQWLNSSLAGSSTPPTGTGNWQHYLSKVVIGTSPGAATMPFFYLTGADGVTWYVGQLRIIGMDQIFRKGGIHTIVGSDGTKFGHAVGISAAGHSNMILAGAFTYTGTSTAHGLFGTPANVLDVFGTGSPTVAQVSGTHSAGWTASDGTVGGVTGRFESGDSGTGVVHVQRAGTQVTFAPSSTTWGFYGSPSNAVDIFAKPLRVNAGNPYLKVDDTNASGRAFNFASGDVAGQCNIGDLTAGVDRTFLNSSAQWGFDGSPSNGLDLFSRISQINASQPLTQYNDTQVSGRLYYVSSGSSAAGHWSVVDNSGGGTRLRYDGSGNLDLQGASPVSGFITAGGGKVSDTSGNLQLKNIGDAVGTTVGPSTTSTTYAVLAEMTQTLTFAGNKVLLIFTTSLNLQSNTTDTNPAIAIFKDGVQLSQDYLMSGGHTGASTSVAFWEFPFAVSFIDHPSAGSHTYDIRWKLNSSPSPSGTLFQLGTNRRFQITELG